MTTPTVPQATQHTQNTEQTQPSTDFGSTARVAIDPSATIRAAVFDYGGVMTEPIFALRSSMPSGLDPAAIASAMKTAMDHRNTDSSWARAERGEITLAEFGADLEKLLPGLGQRFAGGAATSTVDRLVIRQDMVEIVTALRASGITTALCTNNFAEYRPIWRAKLDLEALFDYVIDSSEIGMRKPEPRMYAYVTSLLGVKAHESVFVDDLEANITAAAESGFQTILVGSGDEHLETLRSLLATP